MPNPCHLREPFPQIVVAVMPGMVFAYSKHLIPVLLIEAWCLKIVGVEDHLLTPTGSRFLLCCLEELGSHPVSPQALIDPEGTDITTATPGPSLDSGTDALLVIADKDREPLSIVYPSLRGIILIEAVVQTLDVCGRGMCFDLPLIGVHEGLLCFDASRNRV
jgi:hypothetical protein